MLKRIVPTPDAKPFGPATGTGGFALASIANTSLSGSENFTTASQQRPSSSRQCVPSNLTIRPTSGPAVPWKLVFGPGRPPGAALQLFGPVVLVPPFGTK